MVLEHSLQGFLSKHHGATNIAFQWIHEVLEGLLHERLLGTVLDGVDGHAQLETLKRFVALDVRESLA